MSDRRRYVLFSGSPTKRAVQYAVTLHLLRVEGGQGSTKILVVGKRWKAGITSAYTHHQPSQLHGQLQVGHLQIFTAGICFPHRFQCKLCQHIVDQPIETTYHHHLMYATCVRGCIDNDNWSCPCGDPSHKLSPESLQKPSEIVLKQHATLLVKCERCNTKNGIAALVHTCPKILNHPHLPKLQYDSFGKVHQLPLRHPWRYKQLVFWHRGLLQLLDR